MYQIEIDLQDDVRKAYRLHSTLEQVERLHVEHVMALHKANIFRVAKHLGMSRAAVYRNLTRLGIDRNFGKEMCPFGVYR